MPASGSRRSTIVVMAISGGLAGLAGAVEVGGIYQRIVENMGEGFGLAGIAVALIARLEPVAIPFAACLFGIFFAGAGALQRELALPFPLVWIVEATVIFTVTALHWALPEPKGGSLMDPLARCRHSCCGNTARHGDRACRRSANPPSERSGVFNIGIEGIMLSAAFVAAWGSVRTGSPWLGICSPC